jgi:hypothetical protein
MYTYYEILRFLVNWHSLFLTHVCFAPGRSSGVALNLSGGASDVIVLASYQTTKRTEADPPIRGATCSALAGGERRLQRGDGDVANRQTAIIVCTDAAPRITLVEEIFMTKAPLQAGASG